MYTYMNGAVGWYKMTTFMCVHKNDDGKKKHEHTLHTEFDFNKITLSAQKKSQIRIIMKKGNKIERKML